ncbi:MAG: type II toxin-antitoxin system Phd/YefM family antitoxin [bacterium]|nr:type II toxin-antitoxin system Phd/YefM family antitoxin [bacterium]MCY3924676.1 type II toxin-antitoxin system Phd/YefM family antitoxin [bacterium]MCY4101661.1 type II toxin-antitoxin system Phd/YefM family antitoxin [bacterium]
MPQVQEPLPETMPAGEFKAKCLAIMDRVAETGGQVIITKYGHPVAALVPCPLPAAGVPELWGSCRGEITVSADLTEPTGDGDEDWIGEWEAEWDELLPEFPEADSDTAPAS